MNKIALYLCSTPLHCLNAVAIASTQAQGDAHLWLIDQPNIIDNAYFTVLSNWQQSPFSSVRISQGHIKSTGKKLAQRKQTFLALKTWIEQHKPTVIYTGNDRRIEFQYAMHCATHIGLNPIGIYMDEGTFTYVGRSASSSFSDRIVDNYLKKITYGFWWKNPPTIGGSDWITHAYVAFPELVHPLLQSKTLIPLQPLYHNNATLQSFSTELAHFFNAPIDVLTTLDCVLTLPHESIIADIPGYLDAMKTVVAKLQERGLHTGIKYHPRNSNPDILDAKTLPGVELLPHQIPFEALLPLLPKNVIIIGDVSSTLINSRWLKPEARLISIANPKVALYDEFCDFFSAIDVSSCQIDQLTEALETMMHNQ